METVFIQKIVGINRDVPFPVPFPVSLRATVCNWNNIEYDLDSITIFQKAECYFQPTAKSKIKVGKNCFGASNVAIITANHDINDLSKHSESKEVVIGENFWIGFGSVRLFFPALCSAIILLLEQISLSQ